MFVCVIPRHCFCYWFSHNTIKVQFTAAFDFVSWISNMSQTCLAVRSGPGQRSKRWTPSHNVSSYITEWCQLLTYK